MGTNITALAIGHGVPVVLVDVSEAVLSRAREIIAQKLRHAQLMGALPPDRPRGELVTSMSLRDAADATTVIEAVTELPETKAKVLAEVSAAVRPGTTLISNTSCIPIDEMADLGGARRRARRRALHEPVVPDQDGGGHPGTPDERRHHGSRSPRC